MNSLHNKNQFADLQVLVVDDEPDISRGIQKLIQSIGATVMTALSAEDAIRTLEQKTIDLVISDIKMSGMTGIELMHQINVRWQSTSVVLITGFGTVEMAVACLQQGAAHFLTKPFDNSEIIQTVERIGRKILAEKKLRISSTPESGGIIAEDRKMKTVMELVDQVASTRVPVLITGESGTGKELIARAIHSRSKLRDKPFLAVNCAALPDTLLESELFGYKKGAFTGAHKDHRGIFTQVNGGSVFLDEIPSMSLAFQGKLLRVLQEKVIRPLGSTADEEVEFRLICSSNRNLTTMVEQREFREDLFYRLSVFTIHIPPLRERRDDIMPLAINFLKHAASMYLDETIQTPILSMDALDELSAYSWPGNVRELENTIQRALITCRGSQILPHHLLHQANVHRPISNSDATSYEEAKQEVLEKFQRQFLERILEQTHGNITQAADACGLTRAAVQKLIKKLKIDKTNFRVE